MEATKALLKIAQMRRRIKGVQGGQGAGKTYAILILLINHASSNVDKEIYIASAELSKMRTTIIKDFVKILKQFGIYEQDRFKGETLYTFRSGSFIKFLGLDKDDIGKGLRSDVVYINEGNKIGFESYRELTSRASIVYIDFNPNKKFWFHNEVEPRKDCDSIILTYKDNKFIKPQELNEILSYKEKGYDKDGKIINTYWANMWRIYGLGEVGQVEGRIYNWGKIPYEDYLKLELETYYGVDWGKVDPFAVTEVKYKDGNLYVHEINYKSENEIRRGLSNIQLEAIKGSTVMDGEDEHDGLVSWIFSRAKIDKDALICCDNNRPNKIRSLRRAGWDRAVAVGGKMDLINRIGMLSDLNIFYTSTSINIELEQEAYCYDKDKEGRILEKPIDQDNHAIDSIVYIVAKLFEMGIIKSV